MNRPYYGDNLQILREHGGDESVDLVHLDPPFKSNATYNVLFRAPTGEESQAQIEAFEDTWHWNEAAEESYWQVLKGPNTEAARMLEAMRGFLGENDMMAYLAMMAVRLLELHRVLKPTGSLYLHCDPTASHYLKILLDAVFGPMKFRNEVIWKRTSSKSDFSQGAKHFPPMRLRRTRAGMTSASDRPGVDLVDGFADGGAQAVEVIRLAALLQPAAQRCQPPGADIARQALHGVQPARPHQLVGGGFHLDEQALGLGHEQGQDLHPERLVAHRLAVEMRSVENRLLLHGLAPVSLRPIAAPGSGARRFCRPSIHDNCQKLAAGAQNPSFLPFPTRREWH